MATPSQVLPPPPLMALLLLPCVSTQMELPTGAWMYCGTAGQILPEEAGV
jgi:hypothetical protein